jgi:hypothetical protein
MASSGTIINDFRTGYRLQIVWSVNSQNVTNNTSNVTATVQLVSTSSAYTISSTTSKSVSLTINGVTYSSTCTVGISGNQTKSLFSQTVDIAHNADGTKTCSFSSDVGLNVTLSGVYWGTVSASGSGTFDTIARASQPTLSASTADMNTTITIYTHRASTSFTHTLRYIFGNASGTIVTGLPTDYNWTIPLELANQVPNSISGYGAIYCDTYNGSTFIGTTTVGFTANVPSNVVPSFSTITNAEANTTVSSIVGKYVQGLSKLNLAILGATGSYSSYISSYQIIFDGSTYNSSSATSGTIKSSGTLTITGKITDSRGRTATINVNVVVIAYIVPNITVFTLARCNSNGTTNDMGTYVKIISSGTVASLINGTEKNSLTYRILSKTRTTSTWTSNKNSTLVNLNLSATDILGTFDAISSFDFRLEITDKFNTTISLNVLPTGQVAMSWGKNGVGIGKVWEQGTLDVGGDIFENGTSLVNKYLGKNAKALSATTADSATSATNANYASKLRRYPENDGYWMSHSWQGGLNGFRLVANNDSGDEQANIHRTSVNIADEVWYAGKHSQFSWNGTAPANVTTTVTHNLGYTPIVVFNGTIGNLGLTYAVTSTQLQLYCYNTANNGFSGLVYLY